MTTAPTRMLVVAVAALLFTRSGGIFDTTRYAEPCEVSRQTIMNYLAVLEATFVVQIVRPSTPGKRSVEACSPGFSATQRSAARI